VVLAALIYVTPRDIVLFATGPGRVPVPSYRRYKMGMDDCFQEQCSYVSCEQMAYVKAVRDAFRRRKEHDDCADAVMPNPDQPYTCPTAKRDGTPLSRDEVAALLKKGCEQRNKVAAVVGTRLEPNCDRASATKLRDGLPGLKTDVCNDPRAMCAPDQSAAARPIAEGGGKGRQPAPFLVSR
jgi:hypothetical protein